MNRRVQKYLMLLLIASVALFLTVAAGNAEEAAVPDDIVYAKPVKGVIFSHKTHTGKGMDCSSCHTKLFNMNAKEAEGKADFTMKGLYAGKYCGACHAPGGTAFASSTQCARCHIGVKGTERIEKSMAAAGGIKSAAKTQSSVGNAALAPKKSLLYTMKDAAPVSFSHAKHMAKAKCADCHASLWPMKKSSGKMTMEKMYEGKYCGACHNEKKAFDASDCTRCHIEKK